MGFFEAIYTTCIKKYFVFSGRASRSEFWWFKLFYAIISWVIGFLIIFLLMPGVNSDPTVTLTYLFQPIVIILQIGITIPSISVAARRLHDKNMSGFWSIIVAVPFLLQFMLLHLPKISLNEELIGSIAIICYIANLVLHIIFISKGTDGSNKYGPDPLKPHVDAEVFS